MQVIWIVVKRNTRQPNVKTVNVQYILLKFIQDTADETFKDEEDVEEELDELDTQDDKDVDEVPPMMTESIVGKEIVDDELMATRWELTFKFQVFRKALKTLKALQSYRSQFEIDFVSYCKQELMSRFFLLFMNVLLDVNSRL